MSANLIDTQGDENWVLSPDGAYIYVAGNDGYLTVFDARTGESLYSVHLGADLGAISLSPDGTRLAVVEEVPENVQQFQSSNQNSADVSFYIVDLSTFGAQKLTYHVTAEAYTFADVTWSDNDTLQLSQNILPGWSGWAPLATVELATGELTEHSSYYSGLGTSASLLTIPGSNTVLLGQLGLSSAEYFLIGPDGTSLRSNGVYTNDVYGSAGGIEAASGTTESDRIIIVTGGGAHLYDGTMSYIGNLASLYPNLGNAAGVTFSADGQRLFFLDSTNQAVVVVDAFNYSVVATVPLTDVIFETLKWGEEIVVAPDGNGIYYNTSSGISYVAVDLPDLGTDGADQLYGTAGDDIIDGRAGDDFIYGLAGDDWLIGGPGNDLIDGGDGFDIASYETATTGVNVDLGIAGAQATVGADYDTLVSIEGLSGSVFSDTLTGNANNNLLLGYDGNDTLYGLAGDDDLYGENGDDQLFGGEGVDWLFGGSGADWLDGGTGADRLEGGDGNDTYVVDDPGDLVLETATGGYDTMRVSNFNATIASGVEALIIVSGAFNATGDFAANSLTGSDQDNVLSGLGGNDMLNGLAGNDVLIGGAGADTLTGGLGADTFRGTAAEMSGDTITDFTRADRIVISDANIASFTFSQVGSTLTFSGGSLTLIGVSGSVSARAAAGGGVELILGNGGVTGDFGGDAYGDILWRNSSGAIGVWTGSASGRLTADDASIVAVPNDWQVTGTGDFNGDGQTDILWRHSNGQVGDWLGSANGFAVNSGSIVDVPTDWQVAGVGDFNGDARDDILWRNANGTIGQWMGDGSGNFVVNDGTLMAVPTDWQVAGVGDFDGDGRDDILWRHVSGTVGTWSSVDGGFAADNSLVVEVSLDWVIVGTGDFNGDGRDDILWRNDNGMIGTWLGLASHGFQINDTSLDALGNGWQVAAIGDYNGDGRDDLALRSDSGEFTDWLGTASGGFVANDANAAAVVELDWHIEAPDLFLQ